MRVSGSRRGGRGTGCEGERHGLTSATRGHPIAQAGSQGPWQEVRDFVPSSKTHHEWMGRSRTSLGPGELAIIDGLQIRADTTAFTCQASCEVLPKPKFIEPSGPLRIKHTTGPALQMGFWKRPNRGQRSVSGRARPKTPFQSLSSPCPIRTAWCFRGFGAAQDRREDEGSSAPAGSTSPQRLQNEAGVQALWPHHRSNGNHLPLLRPGMFDIRTGAWE